MNSDQTADDYSCLDGLTYHELMTVAEEEDSWAELLLRIGEWPSKTNDLYVAMLRERVAECRIRAERKKP